MIHKLIINAGFQRRVRTESGTGRGRIKLEGKNVQGITIKGIPWETENKNENDANFVKIKDIVKEHTPSGEGWELTGFAVVAWWVDGEKKI